MEGRLVELAIITVGRVWSAEFEFAVHAPNAVKAGIDRGTVESIRRNETPEFVRDDEAAVYLFAKFLGDRSLTPQQIRFVEMVIDQLTARGVMDASALYIVLCPCGQWPATLSALRSGALILRTLMRCVVFWAFTLFLWSFSRC